MWRIWWAPNNASKWQMGFNLVFIGLKWTFLLDTTHVCQPEAIICSTLLQCGEYKLDISCNIFNYNSVDRNPQQTGVAVSTALHCTALHSTALHCTAQHCTAQHCTALHSTAQHCTALHSTALHSTALPAVTLNSLSEAVIWVAKYCTVSAVGAELTWWKECPHLFYEV
jgi:hypothetical protein